MKVTVEEFLDWNHNHFLKYKQRDLRYGQSFCNHFNITDPELFYEVEYDKAAEIVRERYLNGV